MKNIILYTLLLLSFIGTVNGQLMNFTPASYSVTQSEFGITQSMNDPNTFYFSPAYFINSNQSVNPPINYTYLWSFGDGQYSTDPDPSHTYPQTGSAEEYQVVLYATPVYIPTGPPPALYLEPDPNNSSLIQVPGNPFIPTPSFMDDADISLSYNRLPRATYESTFILSYRNASGITTNAPFQIYLDYNSDYFVYKGAIAPGGETYEGSISPSANAGTEYPDRLIFETTGSMYPDEERTIFIQMEATAEVIGEMEELPEGIIEIENAPKLFVRAASTLGTAVPPLQAINPPYYDKVNMYAVGSWDPNNKISSIQYINRDGASLPQKIRYRINCENVGTGATSSVRIKDHVNHYLDLNSGTIVDQKDPNMVYETPIIDPSSRTIEIPFNDLALQGTNSDNNVNISDCQYWVDIEYDIDPIVFDERFGPSITCDGINSLGNFGTHAEIIFDTHNAILTNVANTEVFCETTSQLQPLEITNVFPNPIEDIIDITYVILPTATLDLSSVNAELIDINTGAIEGSFNLVLNESEGTHQVQLDLSFANSGSYVLVMEASGFTFTSPTIVKQ